MAYKFGTTKADVGLANAENTSDANKNVLSATRLTTARNINGVSFNGTANITIPTGIQRSVQSITTPTTLPVAANTDYVIFAKESGVVPDTSTVALLSGQGTNGSTVFTDSSFVSPNSALLSSNWTRWAGSATISTTEKKFGTSSIYLPGSSNLLSNTTLLSNYQWGTGDFTIEMWYYPTVGGYQALYWHSGGSFIQLNGTTVRYLANGAQIVGLVGSLALNQWHHIAVARQSGTTRLFGNGVLLGSGADSLNYAPTGQAVLGSEGTGGSGSFTGYINDFRLTKGLARYTAAFTPPTAALTVQAPVVSNVTLPTAASNTNKYEIFNSGKGATASAIAIKTNGTDKIEVPATALFTDGTGKNLSVVAASTPWIATTSPSSTIKKFASANSMLFWGGTLRPATSADQNYAYGTGDFTIDFYIYRLDTVDRVVYDGRSGTYSTGGYGGPFPGIYFTTNKIKFAKFDAFEISSTTNFAANTWYHVAVCRKNSFTTLYVNGVPEASIVDTGNYLNIQVGHFATTGACTPYIGGTNTGSYSDNWGWSFYGHISHLRIIKGVGLYTQAFTPPDENLGSNEATLQLNQFATVISDGTMYKMLP